MEINKTDTAYVFIDPQNDVLSEGSKLGRGVSERHREQDRRKYGEDIRGGEGGRIRGLHLTPPLPPDRQWMANQRTARDKRV
ncbi:hypothetical protein [Streptomyces sp. NPDC019507]|uniref:hypothetical protein n=1 Tax=Streptomyces sp. NPDC019507 TaxID=3154689 RepID=UPI0033F90B79